MLDDLTPKQIRAAVMPALIANYREWVFLVQCGRCLKAVSHVSPHTLLARDQAMTIEGAIVRLRCSSRRSNEGPCGGAPGYFAIQANDGSVRIVIIGSQGVVPRIEHPTAF